MNSSNSQIITINSAMEQKCQAIYDEITALENQRKASRSPGEKWVSPAKGWIYLHDEKNDLVTWTLDLKKITDPSLKEKYLPWVGTNQQLVVKISNINSYDFVKTEDFINRANLLFAAAKEFASLNMTDKQEELVLLIENLSEMRRKLTRDIAEKANLEKNAMRAEDKRTYFNDQCKEAEILLHSAVINIANLLRNPLNLERNEVIASIQEQEKKLIAKEGRPTIFKIGQIVDIDFPKNKNRVTMISAQFPQGSQTIPSSIRTGSYDKKLSNHVLDISAHITKDQQLKVDLVIDGHSSYPPIAEKDEIKRRYIAYLAVKEKITNTANLIFQANPHLAKEHATKNNPLIIPLSTMMLLSPMKGKWIESKVRRLESEHGQLSDSSYGLEMMRHTPPMEIKLPGNKKVFIKVDLSYMNLPTNISKLKQSMVEDPLQNEINERGFHEYCENMKQGIQQQLDGNFDTHYGHATLAYVETENMAIHKALMHFNATIKKLEPELKEKYALLTKIMHDYNEALNHLQNKEPTEDEIRIQSEVKKNIQAEYVRIKNTIIKLEEQLASHYQEMNALRKERFIKSSSVRKNLTLHIKRLLKDKKTSPELREHCLLQQRFLKLQKMYHHKSYMKTKNAYRFHVLYLLTNASIFREIEAFCKSAEDRTGWLRISLLAHKAFNQVEKRDPIFSDPKDKEKYDKYYAAAAYELSASLENTEYNSKARGLQINSLFTNAYIGVEMGKRMAKQAKGIYHIEKPFFSKMINYVKTEIIAPASRLLGGFFSSRSDTSNRHSSLLPHERNDRGVSSHNDHKNQ